MNREDRQCCDAAGAELRGVTPGWLGGDGFVTCSGLTEYESNHNLCPGWRAIASVLPQKFAMRISGISRPLLIDLEACLLPWERLMSLILIILLLVLIFGGGGGYYAHRSYGGYGSGGVIGLIVIVLIVVWLFGGFGVGYH
jgi:hypothetical protein